MKKPKFKVIFRGPIRGDCCSHNIFTLEEPMTVREMCEYILSTDEWGYIGIYDGCSFSFGSPNTEYIDHHYCDSERNPIEMNWPDKILNAYVKQIDWDGGWSRGDWLFTL